MIYFLKHIDIEGPGTLGDFFQRKAFAVKTIHLYNGEKLPSLSKQIEAVVILGGPMNVYEENIYPFLSEETAFIRELVKRDVPTIGLCLGAQLIAKALGAKVYKAPVKEIGFYPLQLTKEGRGDQLFQGLPEMADFFEWHEDTFDLPEGAELLIKGTACRHQAFRVGSSIYGFQCHMEIKREDAFSWLKRYQGLGPEYKRIEKKFNEQFDRYEERFYYMAEKLYKNLFYMIKNAAAESKVSLKA